MLILGFSLFKSIIKFEKSVIFGIYPTLGHIGLYGGNPCMALSQFWYACMCIGLFMGYMYWFWLYSMVYSSHIMNLPYIYAIFDTFSPKLRVIGGLRHRYLVNLPKNEGIWNHIRWYTPHISWIWVKYGYFCYIHHVYIINLGYYWRWSLRFNH